MTRAIYIPAGVPLWTNTIASHSFSHLNLHFHKDRLLKYLRPSLGISLAMTTVRSPVELQDIGALEILARLLEEEVSNPSQHSLYVENLIGTILARLLVAPRIEDKQGNGRLTQAQINKLNARIGVSNDGRLSVSEMAATVGLSESWFSNVFKQTTGQTPLNGNLQSALIVLRSCCASVMRQSQVSLLSWVLPIKLT